MRTKREKFLSEEHKKKISESKKGKPTISPKKFPEDINKSLIKELSPIYRKVISLFYGLENKEPHTYKEIVKMIRGKRKDEISLWSVVQIKYVGMEILRNLNKLKKEGRIITKELALKLQKLIEEKNKKEEKEKKDL